MKVKFTTNIDKKLLEKTKIKAIQEGKNVNGIIENLLEEYLKGEKEMTINNVLDNITKLIGSEFDTEEIVIAFEDYSYEGESEIIVSQSNNEGYDYVAYADDVSAPQILLKVEGGILTDAWIA